MSTVTPPPVAESKQRLAVVRELAVHWVDKVAAEALLRETNLEVLPHNGASESLLFTQPPTGWFAKLSFQASNELDDRAAVEEFIS